MLSPQNPRSAGGTRQSQSATRSPLKQSRSDTRQKSIIMKIQESLTKHKSLNQANPQQSMKRLQSESHILKVQEKTPADQVARQKQRESEFISTKKKLESTLSTAVTSTTTTTSTTASKKTSNQTTTTQSPAVLARDPHQTSQIESDYTYVMAFMVNQIEQMRKNIESTGLTDEIRSIFPTREKLERTWEEQHPAEICTILADYVRFFVRMNERFMATKQEDFAKFDAHDEKQLILHSVELEKLQFDKKENEYLFAIEQLQKRREELEQKLSFMERHCSEAIRFLTNDNSELINLVKDKDVVMDKIQEQIEIKNEHIRSQDQKLLSVLIYEFKLRKVDIRYQAQILKIMKHHSSDLEKYYDMLESCWRGLNKCVNSEIIDQFNYLKAYVQGIKNDLFNQIINIQSKQEKFFDNFNDKKKNFHQLNEVQDKIQENQLFQNEGEMQKKTQSKFSKVNFAQQIQSNILTNANLTKKHRKQVRSIKDVQFMLDDQQFNQQPNQQVGSNGQPAPAAFNGGFSTFQKSNKNIDLFGEQETSPTKYQNNRIGTKSRVASSLSMMRNSAGFLSTTSTATQLSSNPKNNQQQSYSKNNSVLMGASSAQHIKNPQSYIRSQLEF